jgi:alkylation response protein AidB-like acyl-CoA dehydrogenase
VDFELSDDQRALQDAARDLMASKATSEQVRALVGSDDAFDSALWRAMVDQGWLGVDVAEDLGGLGLGMVEAAVLLEQSGRAIAPAPFLSGVVALNALTTSKDDRVAGLLAGGTIACVAWPIANQPDLTAATDGDGWALSGRGGPAPYAPVADVAVVPAKDGSGDASLFAVDLEGRRPAREPAMDLTRPLGWLDLDGAPATRLGGPDAVAALLDRAATAASAEMLGAAQRAMELSVEYAKERVQFDRPIGSFQAVKHRCADMLVDVEGMRSAVYWAAWCIGAGHPDASIAASTAKVWCSDASRRVMASALQVHGGIGFTWEHDIHLLLKRAQLDQVSFGSASFHRDRLVALLRARVAAGDSLL